MVTIQVDDETYAVWNQRANAVGVTVTDWLKSKTIEESPSKPHNDQQNDEWLNWLHTFAKSQTPTGHPVDDSRESIYD